MSTSTQQRPAAPAPRRANPVLAFLRNTWRGLTSMRTALILLFLLAVASLPGALLPQWSLNQSKTLGYIDAHPFWGPLLNRLGFFEVFGSPWYSAIYLLLFISLIGCLLPRTFDFVRQLRAVPVKTPRNLARLPLHAELTVDGTPEQVADRVRAQLQKKRWRVAMRPDPADPAQQTISAEKGYLRELGNLVFHFSLVGLLVAVAVGKLFGYEGSVITPVGQEFCSSSPVQYDNFRPGLTVDGTDMTPFCLDVQTFHTEWSPTGQALAFDAGLRYQSGADPATGAGSDTWAPYDLRVNEPLRMDGDRVYLLGHGYAPTMDITFPNGEQRSVSANFISNDASFLSSGTIKVTDPPGVPLDQLTRHQLAITGLFAPTAVVNGGIMTSGFPAPDKPGMAVRIFRGDLGLEAGRAQSIFAIDQGQVDKGALTQIASVNLFVGESTTLDDGTKVTFTGFGEWVSLQTSYDPGQFGALLFAITLLLGLMVSLTIKRRRVWFRLESSSTSGSTVVQVGGLARTDQAGYGAEFDEIAALAGPAQHHPEE